MINIKLNFSMRLQYLKPLRCVQIEQLVLDGNL